MPGTLLNADANGDGAVNTKDLTEAVLANGHAVGSTAPSNFPAFQLLAGDAPTPSSSTRSPQAQIQALLPSAIDAWRASGLNATDVQRLTTVAVGVGDLGPSILALEATGTITINRTAAGHDWYTGTGSPSAGQVNLLTVLEHELGHILGLPDNATPGDLMDITLGAGDHQAPSTADLAAVEAAGGSVLATPTGAPL